MRNIFQTIPFIRITGLFLTGILISQAFYPDAKYLAAFLVILISILLLGWYNQNYLSIRIQNILLSFTLIVLGIFYHDQSTTLHQDKEALKSYFLAEVCQKPGEKANSFQTVLLIRNKQFPSPERILAYFSKEGFDQTMTTGDQLMILARLQEIKNSGNPFEFDYKTLMNERNIWYSVFLTKGTYLKTQNHVINFGNWAEKIRDRLIISLQIILPNQEERAVVSALTLGYRTELDQETLDYFASTGAMHVLSVSGLHVALIYFILGFLLSFLKKGKAGRITFSIAMITFLWGYAIISGFSPPVQRATVMFTFVIIGDNIRRPVNIYNSLTASALFLILLNPAVLFDVGFQLSYLAIFGIVLIQPLLNDILVVKNPILKWAWVLFTVSVAAQIMTFPLGFYYFNQFPNLFWLSNFAVIPITTILMWLTLAYFIVLPFNGFAALIGIGIQKLTWLMLFVLKEIDQMPLAVTRGVVLNSVQVVLIFGAIASILIFVFSKRNAWLYTFLSLIVLFQLSQIHEKSKVFNQKKIIVYNSKSRMLHLIDGRRNYLITEDTEKITEKERDIFERTGYHLRLDKPELISFQNAKKINLQDCKFIDKSIIFGSALIRFDKANETKEYLEHIDLTILGLEANKPTLKTAIYFNKPPQTEGTETISVNTRESGAFIADLKQ